MQAKGFRLAIRYNREASHVRVIAVTGGIGSGKSTLTALYRKLGAQVIDADAISRALTAPQGEALPAIRAAFGDGVFAPDGTLDRPALAALVFGEGGAARRQLEGILHPLVIRHTLAELARISATGAQTSPGYIDLGAAGAAGGTAWIWVRAVTGTATNAAIVLQSSTATGFGSPTTRATTSAWWPGWRAAWTGPGSPRAASSPPWRSGPACSPAPSRASPSTTVTPSASSRARMSSDCRAASSRTRAFTTPMSTVSPPPVRMPKVRRAPAPASPSPRARTAAASSTAANAA